MFFLLVFLIYTLINSYLFLKGWKILPNTGVLKILYSGIFFVFYASFIIAMLGRNLFPLGLQKPLYLIGTVWLGAMLYLTLWFLLTDLIYGLRRFFFLKRIPTALFRRIRFFAGYTIVTLILIAGYYHFTHPVIVEREIIIHKSGGKHRDLKIVAFSDIHLGVAIDKKRLQQYVRLINDQHPDLILIAGDLVDNNILPLNKETMQDELNQLQAPLGVYMCPGNHEYLSGIESSLAFLRKTNIRLLIDQAVPVDDSFWIIGRDDLQGNKHRKPLDELVAQTNPLQPIILLDHEPYFLEDAVKNGVDIQFSGHTHYGQLYPLHWIVDRIFEIGHGYRQLNHTHIYVSSGLGLWGPPFRVGTQSELVVLHLRFRH